MRAVIQRVTKCQVFEKEPQKLVGEIGMGLFILLGVGKKDNFEVARALATKIINLRIFSDKEGKMNLNLKESGGSAIVVSQFTLMANTNSGNRPSFIEAAEKIEASSIYEHFVSELSKHTKVEKGSFGQHMEIKAQLDGPVTIVI